MADKDKLTTVTGIECLQDKQGKTDISIIFNFLDVLESGHSKTINQTIKFTLKPGMSRSEAITALKAALQSL
jgi:hypothetical protein